MIIVRPCIQNWRGNAVLLFIYVFILLFSYIRVGPSTDVSYEQGRKRLLDTPKRMIERREREGEREKER